MFAFLLLFIFIIPGILTATFLFLLFAVSMKAANMRKAFWLSLPVTLVLITVIYVTGSVLIHEYVLVIIPVMNVVMLPFFIRKLNRNRELYFRNPNRDEVVKNVLVLITAGLGWLVSVGTFLTFVPNIL